MTRRSSIFDVLPWLIVLAVAVLYAATALRAQTTNPTTVPTTSPTTVPTSQPSPFTPQPKRPYPLDARGWSIIPPGAHQWHIAPDGDDKADGSEKTPLKTTAMAMARARSGDDILWRYGGTYDAPGGCTLSNITFGAYGPQGLRPVLVADTRYTSGFLLRQARGVRIVDLDMRAANRDPATPGFDQTKPPPPKSGVNSDGVGDILIEGCSIRWFGTNLVVEGWLTPGLVIRRSFIGCAYSTDGSYSHGLLCNRLLYPLVEECTIFQNGWNPNIAAAKPTMFNHAFYDDSDDGATEATVRRCIVINNSTGVQLRPGGWCTGNFFQSNGLDVDAWAGGSGGETAYNVVTGNPDPGPWLGGGLMLQGYNPAHHHNLVVNSSPTQLGKGLAIQWPDPNRPGQKQLPAKPPAGTRSVVTDNTVVNWGPENLYVSATRSRNDWQRNYFGGATRKTVNLADGTSASYTFNDNAVGPSSLGITWCGKQSLLADLGGIGNIPVGGAVQPNPDVSAQAYAKSLGLTGNLSEFVTALQGQCKANWSDSFTAASMVDWARRAYGLPGLP